MLLPEENTDEPPYAAIDGTTSYKSRLPCMLGYVSVPFVQQTLSEKETLHFLSSPSPHHVEQEHLFSFRHCMLLKKCHERYETFMLQSSDLVMRQPSASVCNGKPQRGILQRIPHYPQFQRETASQPALILQTLLINPIRKHSLFKGKMKGFHPLPSMSFSSPRGSLQTCIARCYTSTQVNMQSLLLNVRRPTYLYPP